MGFRGTALSEQTSSPFHDQAFAVDAHSSQQDPAPVGFGAIGLLVAPAAARFKLPASPAGCENPDSPA
jgi:hypothetical protein